MNYKLNILPTILFLIFSNILYAQNNLEHSYAKLETELNKKISTLDSLNHILEQKVTIINTEKLKSKKDNKKITELLSKTANLTNAIDKRQIEIDLLTERLDANKIELYKFYTDQIDSLKNRNLAENIKSVEIIRLTEKRLLVSPKIDILSFSPQSVLKIKHPADSVEKKIFNEYLTDAYNEVEIKINEIEMLKLEIHNIIELNNETKEFLEDIDFDNNFAVYTNPQGTTTASDALSNPQEDIKEYARSNSLSTQTKSFSEILYQFGLSNSFNTKTLLNSDKNSVENNLHEFNKLMEVVEKQLNDYRTIINNKLKTTNNKL
jgi:uncharacterized coiled-coil protein SlyX